VAGQAARLDLDVRHRDNYGRLLSYVFVRQGRKRLMANGEMVRLGYAQVMTIPPNVKHQELFLKLQRDSRDAGRGLWGQK
jgi:micrococcal nuclease